MSSSYIYILDEKVKRQESLAPYLKSLKLIRLITDPSDLILSNLDELFRHAFLICLHNSFFQSTGTPFKIKLEKMADERKIKMIIFGGGIEAISFVGEGLLYLPLSRFYKNLEYFYEDQFLKSKHDLNILAFGENMKNEQVLKNRARLTYIVNDLKENDHVKITDSRTIGELKRYGEIVGDLSLYYLITKGEELTREIYLLKLENQAQRILNE